jgi:selenocysteine-specific elongation factor
MAREKADELSRAILDLLAAFHEAQPDQPGLTLEKLRLQAPLRLKSPAFKAFLAILAEQGKLTLQGAWARLPGHAVRLSDEDERLWRAMAPMLANDMRFRPPRTRDIANALALDEQLARKILKRQASCGLVDEIAHDHFFLRATTAEIAEILQDIAACAPRGEITAALLRDRLNNGRKVAIQILDFFDRHGYTIRRGDLRRMNYNRLNMFAVAPAPEQE